MLRGASVKSTCSRMVCAASIAAKEKNKKTDKLQPHIPRTRTERIRPPPVEAKAEGYRKCMSECKRERTGVVPGVWRGYAKRWRAFQHIKANPEPTRSQVLGSGTSPAVPLPHGLPFFFFPV